MNTTIKSVRGEKYDGEYTGKLIITIDGTIKGVQRNVDADGVISFDVADDNILRMNWTAVSAQLRNGVDGTMAVALNYRLDSAKEDSIEKRLALLNTILAGAKIDVVVEEKDDKDGEDKTVVFYSMSNIQLSNMAKFVIGQYFVHNMLGIEDVKQQLPMIDAMFGVKL